MTTPTREKDEMSEVQVITEPGIYEMTNAEYHAQPALSASGMKTLLEAPAKFKHERENKVYKDHFDIGSAFHARALGDNGEKVVVFDADSWRTKASQEFKHDAHAANQIPLLTADSEKVDEMVEAFFTNPDIANLIDLKRGRIEQSAFWQDERTGVWLRCRFDFLPDPVEGQPFIAGDPKTSDSARTDKWMKKVMDFGYDIQDANYREGARVMGLSDRPRFQFAVIEKSAPYLSDVIELDSQARAIGDFRMREAIDLFARCTKDDHWPGYPEGVSIGRIPAYEANYYEGLI